MQENQSSGFPTRCDTNRPVQTQKQARSLYYPSSENKGTNQLRSYCEAGLRLCFHIGNNPIFSRCSSFNDRTVSINLSQILFIMEQARLICTF